VPKPDRVLVYDFAVSPNDVSLNRSPVARLGNRLSGKSPTEEEIKVGRAVANALAEELVKRISALGLPAQRASGVQPPAEGTLVIEGQFVSIAEGNRLRRLVIGFGAGGSEVKTMAQVYLERAGGQYLVQEFETRAESSKKPGVATPMGVGAAVGGRIATGAAVGGGLGVATEPRQTVEADARRTADELAKHLGQFFMAHGWIAKD